MPGRAPSMLTTAIPATNISTERPAITSSVLKPGAPLRFGSLISVLPSELGHPEAGIELYHAGPPNALQRGVHSCRHQGSPPRHPSSPILLALLGSVLLPRERTQHIIADGVGIALQAAVVVD